MTGQALTDYLEKALLNTILRGQTFTPPSSVYVGLFTVMPTDTTGGTEVSATGTAYARVAATFAAPTSISGSGAQSLPTADVVFPQATAAYGTVVGCGLFDAATGGNLLMYGTLTTAQAIANGNQFVYRAASLQVALD